MAELDYAYLANFVQISDGKINALGASFTHVTALTLPANLSLGLGGRVRAAEDEPPVQLTVRVSPPNGEYQIEFDGGLDRTPASRPYAGKIGLLFAFMFSMPLVAPGLYTVELSLESQPVRRLAFDVALPEP